MSKMQKLASMGQSIWFDYIRRSFINSGQLEKLIEDGLRGITSNPTIFEKAIAGSADYDTALAKLAEQNHSIEEIYESLVLEDISRTADLFRPVYESTEGLDGYVSLEVSPALAHDTTGTITEARRLFAKLDRPNIMIKIPATAAGVSAIAELIADGININVTLMFNLDHYRQVVEAYLQGLERRLQKGGKVNKIASVASFFISRVDAAVDRILETKGNTDLQGQIAIANAKLVYKEFQNIFKTSRWNKLAAAGARVQRVLWASTGTKNPHYSDTLYVDELIGKHTVNTLPPATLSAYRQHGHVNLSIENGLQQAERQLSQLNELGIDLKKITENLQQDGLASFSASFDKLMKTIAEKRERVMAKEKELFLNLGAFQKTVDSGRNRLKEQNIVQRIWEHDFTVWKSKPVEITNRLGWLHSPDVMMEQVGEIETFVEQVRSEGFTHALLLGMGGSSLAPEVFRQIFDIKTGYLNLWVLDSTNPAVVESYTKNINPAKTLFIASTKSGGTVETLSFLKHFYNYTLERVGSERVGSHFIAITDPGSGLQSLAESLNFRKIFLNDPNIGGRYSALSLFGLVPAGLIGVNLRTLIDRAQTMACNCEGYNCPVNGDNSGAILGASLGLLARHERDKLTFIISKSFAPFGAWVEQLIAESTGKENVGILPVVNETILSPEDYDLDRFFIYLKMKGDDHCDKFVSALLEKGQPVAQINLTDKYSLGSEFFRWEMATAIAGYFLNINPFDQPNVEAAKILARKMVGAYQEQGSLPEISPSLQTENITVFADQKEARLDEAFAKFLGQAEQGKKQGHRRSYVAIQAFVEASNEMNRVLQELRTAIQKKYRLATTLGFGPRFLHSTGQLHKGDNGNGLFIQITGENFQDIPIPDKPGQKSSSISFGVLALAQALGDRQALLNAGRKVIRFHIDKDILGGIRKLIQSI